MYYWDESAILKDQFRSLFCVLGNPDIMLADVFIEEGWNFSLGAIFLKEKCRNFLQKMQKVSVTHWKEDKQIWKAEGKQ